MATEVLSVLPSIYYVDPSEHFRPEGKPEKEFRNFSEHDDSYIARRVRETYTLMHTNQTVHFVQSQINTWCKFDQFQLSVMEALEKLNILVDESDPDVDIPNIVHAFQTAERIRKFHPDKPWFQLVGLIHDLGKILAIFGEPQWAVVGDTFPVGCAYQPSIVFRDSTFQHNPDLRNEVYSTKYGIYHEGIGLDNVIMSWGHDEYMYRVLKNHPNCTIPEEGLYIIRFHSFYPWHSGGDYDHLCNDKDRSMLPWIKEFNRFDLYTKSDEMPNIDFLRDYYQGLCDKYIPGKLKF